MKKVLAGLIFLATILPAAAQHRHHGHNIHRHHGHHHHWHHRNHWVAPLVIGAGVTYLATRPAPVIIQEPVIIEREPTNCTEWREVQDSNGNVYRERTCYTR